MTTAIDASPTFKTITVGGKSVGLKKYTFGYTVNSPMALAKAMEGSFPTIAAITTAIEKHLSTVSDAEESQASLRRKYKDLKERCQQARERGDAKERDRLWAEMGAVEKELIQRMTRSDAVSEEDCNMDSVLDAADRLYARADSAAARADAGTMATAEIRALKRQGASPDDYEKCAKRLSVEADNKEKGFAEDLKKWESGTNSRPDLADPRTPSVKAARAKSIKDLRDASNEVRAAKPSGRSDADGTLTKIKEAEEARSDADYTIAHGEIKTTLGRTSPLTLEKKGNEYRVRTGNEILLSSHDEAKATKWFQLKNVTGRNDADKITSNVTDFSNLGKYARSALQKSHKALMEESAAAKAAGDTDKRYALLAKAGKIEEELGSSRSDADKQGNLDRFSRLESRILASIKKGKSAGSQAAGPLESSHILLNNNKNLAGTKKYTEWLDGAESLMRQIDRVRSDAAGEYTVKKSSIGFEPAYEVKDPSGKTVYKTRDKSFAEQECRNMNRNDATPPLWAADDYKVEYVNSEDKTASVMVRASSSKEAMDKAKSRLGKEVYRVIKATKTGDAASGNARQRGDSVGVDADLPKISPRELAKWAKETRDAGNSEDYFVKSVCKEHGESYSTPAKQAYARSDAENRIPESEREKIGEPGSSGRDDMPDSAFLEPASKKYPVKEKKEGVWVYDRALLIAAASRARLQGNDELASKADHIRATKFGSSEQDADHPAMGNMTSKDHSVVSNEVSGTTQSEREAAWKKADIGTAHGGRLLRTVDILKKAKK